MHEKWFSQTDKQLKLNLEYGRKMSDFTCLYHQVRHLIFRIVPEKLNSGKTNEQLISASSRGARAGQYEVGAPR